MGDKKYIEDFKNLKPMPLDRIPGKSSTSEKGQKQEKRKTMIQEVPIIKKEIINMEPLNNSKTLWGFGIAVVIFIVQQVLMVMNIAGPDNMLVNAGIEVIIAAAGFFGVYGIRDALRKMKEN